MPYATRKAPPKLLEELILSKLPTEGKGVIMGPGTRIEGTAREVKGMLYTGEVVSIVVPTGIDKFSPFLFFELPKSKTAAVVTR